jgi:signal transduction histidine kinase/ligand-binding sensor domain-containing protein/DNA-binding response OmpR family regulator
MVSAWALMCLAWTSLAVAAPARDDEVHTLWYRSLGVEQGLSRNFVTSMAADRDGFMWFGTLGGLNRWDGYRFEVFRPDPRKPGSLQSPVIVALHAAVDGGLWSGTLEALYRYDGATSTFRRFTPPDGRAQRMGLITSDAQGRAWVGSFGARRIALVDPRDGTWKEQVVPETIANRIAAIHVDAANRLWMALTPLEAFDTNVDAQSRIVAFDLSASGGTVPLQPPVLSTTGGRVDTIVEDRSGRLWFARQGGGLLRYDPKTRHSDEVLGQAGDDTSLAGLRIQSLIVGPSGAIWMLTLPSATAASSDQRRLYSVDADTLAIEHVVPHERESGPTGDARFNYLASDPSGVLWLATNGGGLRYADVSARGFELYRRESSDSQGLNANFVRAVIRGRDGTVWVGTPRGLNHLDRRAGSSRLDAIALPHPYVQALLEDREGRLWIGTVGGLVVKDRSGRVRLYRHQPEDPRSLCEDYVQVLHETPDGRIWIGTLGGGLDEFDARSESFRHHKAAPSGSTGLPKDEITALYTDNANRLWIGTSAGLARLDLTAGADAPIERITVGASGLEPAHVLSLNESPAAPGALWVGTERWGLCRLEVGTGNVRCFNSLDSALQDDTVYGILPDGGGRLWLSTNRGLSVFDPPTAAFRTYDTDASLQSPEFNARAYFRAPDGEMFFGGVAGLNAFYPDQLRGNPFPPRVFVTAVRTSGGDANRNGGALPMLVYRRGMPLRSETLSYSQREVTFDFVAIHFSDTAGLRYFYRLDGYDADWQGPVTIRSVRYTNLPARAYTFRVRAVTSNGVASPNAADYTFVVRPPFYATTWFRSLIVGSIVLALTVGYRLRTRGARRRQASLEREVAHRTEELRAAADALTRQAEQLKELDAAKSRFFANISHEFRTPLTLTLGPLRDVTAGMHGALPADALHEIEQAIRHTERQLSLVEQLLELARLDSGTLAFTPHPVRLDAVVRIAAAHFESHTKRQAVRFVLALPTGAVHTSADEERLERVVSNLLDNAFKFTPAGGTVLLSMFREGDWATLAVEDTGPGIPADDLPHLFERFYRAARDSDLVPGTGIGLALAKEYIELHGGVISAENRSGGGARFTVRLKADFSDETAATASVPSVVEGQSDGTAAAVSASPLDERANTGPATVLIVDDHPDMRAYVKKHLAPRYRVLEAARGDDGLTVARAELPDVVVCDVMMPGLDGFALCHALKSDPETDFLPIIMLTAKAGAEGRLEGLEHGADDYLTKPFVPAELLARIRNLLTARERLRTHILGRGTTPVRLSAPQAIPSADQMLLDRLRDVLDKSADDEEFDVPALASGLAMSRAQLHRRLKDAFQTTPAEVIVEYRLQRASQMLASRAGNVSEVAYAVGFKNVSHFVKRFRERFGQTPAAWAASDHVTSV